MSEKEHVKTLTELRDEAEKTIAGAITGHDDFVPQFRREADALTFALTAIEENQTFREMVEAVMDEKIIRVRQPYNGKMTDHWFVKTPVGYDYTTTYWNAVDAFKAIQQQGE